ncbi:unnamed protein product, partial [marine sediment metagenome]
NDWFGRRLWGHHRAQADRGESQRGNGDKITVYIYGFA